MKYLRILNTIAFLIPIVVCIVVSIKEHSIGAGFITGLVSTSITGAIQVIIAIIYFYKYPKDKLIKIYFIGVLIFGICWYSFLSDWYWLLPPVLFMLLSYIIYSKRELGKI